ncbi:hypothetical protein AW736_02050 [Termitidicoccus mucosus]|uniref:Uncharacterized protein n=1 Tax=Termitidicoccus mucosus TaxID=1184151 RepID=A0A178INY8_9BACT|nr:hypothetical protein AW736_02050 [Opitutaceae bacterium TSB47]
MAWPIAMLGLAGAAGLRAQTVNSPVTFNSSQTCTLGAGGTFTGASSVSRTSALITVNNGNLTLNTSGAAALLKLSNNVNTAGGYGGAINVTAASNGSLFINGSYGDILISANTNTTGTGGALRTAANITLTTAVSTGTASVYGPNPANRTDARLLGTSGCLK